MCALLDHDTILDYQYAVSIDHCRESVCNHNTSSSLRGLVKCFLDDLLALGVQSRRGLVQKKNLWISNKSSGDGDSLFLTTG